MLPVAIPAGETGFVDVQGARLEWRWCGPRAGGAPTLVFLHEGLGSAGQWRDLPDRLAASAGCGALVYSRAGYGRSSPIAGPRPTSFMHDEATRVLPDLLERFSVREPVLYGHSDGASIALIYAGSRCAPPPRALILEAAHVLVEPICRESIRRLGAAFDAPTPAGAKLRSGFRRHHGDQSEDTVHAWVEVWLRPEFAPWNIQALLPAIDCPVLAIQGEDDAYGTPLQLDLLRSGVSGPVEAHLLARCGHAPHRERRDDVLSLARAFLVRATG